MVGYKTKISLNTKYQIIKFFRLIIVVFILSFLFALFLFILIYGEDISQIEKTVPIDIDITHPEFSRTS